MSENNMEEITIARTGMPPIIAVAKQIGFASSKTVNGKSNSRWDEYTIYETQSGKTILKHEYKTNWQGESGRTEAWVGKSIKEILASYRENERMIDSDRYPYSLIDAIEDAGLSDEIAIYVD